MSNLIKRFKHWLYRVDIDTRYAHKGIYIAGGLINSASDYPMRFDGEDSYMNYWDVKFPLVTFIHGRGYGYSIWIGLVLITLYRNNERTDGRRIDIAWNPD